MKVGETIGDLLQSSEAHYDGYTFNHIEMEDLIDLAKWPKFKDEKLSWANFSATTSALQTRWYQTSVKPKVAWMTIKQNNCDKPLIGRCSVSQPEKGNDLIFGIVLRPDLTDKGVGTKVIKAIIRYLFEVSAYEGIWLESHIDNQRARRVWEKVGFDFVSYHYRRSNYGLMDKFAAYRFSRDNMQTLPEVKINKL